MESRPYELKELLHRAGLRQGWWNSKKILIAVSGGSDSMALLWLMLNYWHGTVVVAHVEHGIRGQSSMADASFVKKSCDELGVPCFIIHRDVPGEAMKGESTEQAARRLRHESLMRKAASIGADFVALAHTSDDVVETFFINMARGTGPYGLAGIPETRDCFVRPVMEASKEELKSLLKMMKWTWVEDETNQEDLYLRNRIRNELLPLLERRINSGIRRHVLSLVQEMAEVRREEEQTSSRLASSLHAAIPWCLYSLDKTGIMELSDLHRSWLFRCVGRILGLRTLSRHRTEALLNLLERSSRWRFQWSEDIELCCCKDQLIWIHRDILDLNAESVVLSSSGEIEWFGYNMNWKYLEEHMPARDLLTAKIPLYSKNDVVDVVPLSMLKKQDRKTLRGSFPWCLESRIPVLRLNETPVWSPRLGEWDGRWVFPSDSVKCDGVCRISFIHPRKG